MDGVTSASRAETHNVEPGVTYGSRFMDPLAATVLAVPFAAGRELLLRIRYVKVMVFSLVSLRGLQKHSESQH